MKKLNYLALAATVAMAACSSDDGITQGTSQQPGSDLVEIQLNVSQPASMVLAKGTGSVGDVDGTTNIWNAEKVNIYMLEKGTMNLAYFNKEARDNNNPIYDGATFITPAGEVSEIASAEDGSIKYYPPTGQFDFWGYRLDDCVLGTLTKDDEKIAVPFELDGSQDIMVGKAELTAVQPDITFKHLLTRLTFQAKAKTKSVCDATSGVHIDKIEITAKNKGTLTLAYTDAVTSITSYKDQLQVDDDETILSLKDKTKDADGNLNPLEPVLPTWDDVNNETNTVDVGESLMIPAADQYELKLYLHQSKPSTVGGTPEPIPYVMPYTLKTADASPFLMGYSYNVVITINGLQEIEITTTLEPWNDGGDIEINPEDENM